MTTEEYLDSLLPKLSWLTFWYAYWFFDFSFDDLYEIVARADRANEKTRVENYCKVIALKKLYLTKYV